MAGGQKQVNSGRFWRWKRDVKLWNFLLEARTTTAKTYRLDSQEFLDIEKQARMTPPGMKAGIQVDFPEVSVIVIRLAEFQEMQMLIQTFAAMVEEEENGDETRTATETQ